MDEIVICDTNAVIQLATICPKLLLDKSNGLNLVVHPKVIEEIEGLKKNEEKYERLGVELDFITAKVTVSQEYKAPDKDEYDDMDETITLQESVLPSDERSAQSSPKDRFFLILAQHNELKLLTREKTLFYLSRAILSIDRAWGISDALIFGLDSGITTRREIEDGMKELAKKKETIPERCYTNLRDYIKI